MNRLLFIFAYCFLSSFYAFGQSQITGSQDYGMAGSSVMWLPRSSAIFLNPSMLGRIHQGEFLVATHRFSTLPSLSGAYFVPHVGTFSLGVANEPASTMYSVGYGRLLSKYFLLGGALNFLRNGTDHGTLSLGSSVHLPDTEHANSGLLIGASVVHLSLQSTASLLGAHVGAAYWVMPNFLRLQTAWQYQAETSEGLGGVLVRLNQWVSVYAGTISFKNVTGGFGFRSTYVNADLAFAEPGVSFSLSFRFTDGARDVRDRHFERGKKVYDEERYAEAFDDFISALGYDEYYSPARTMANLSISAKETSVVVYLREGKANEERSNYVAAIKMYSQVLKTDPDNQEARARLSELELRFRSRVYQLITMGDSLRNLKKYDLARSAYRDVLDFDPNNQEVAQRLADMDAMIKERIKDHLSRARTFRAKNQNEEARREYEQVLVYNPKHPQAQSSLESLKAQRTATDLFQRAKTVFDQRNHYEALTIFLDVLQRDPKNRDAKSYIDRAREILQRDVEETFKNGLQMYVKENYHAALEVWDRVLVIQPNHQATLEYSKRARDKLEALEKLK